MGELNWSNSFTYARRIQIRRMPKWIAFDEDGTGAAAAQTKSAVVFLHGDALDSAIACDGPAVVILPDQRNQLALLNLRRNSPNLSDEPAEFEATGFLGLTDRVLINEERKQRCSWWKRFRTKP